MIVYRKINTETGLFVADEVHSDHPVTETGEPDPAYIETPVPPDVGFWWPRWNGTVWVEGGTAPEPVTPEPTPEEVWKIGIEAALIELAGMISGGV